MKKIGVWCSIFALLLACLTLSAAAEQGEFEVESDAIADELEGFKSAIPPEVADLLPEGFFSGDVTDMATGVKEAGGLSAILSVVGRLTGLSLAANLRLLAVICGVLCLSAVLRAMASGKESGRALGFCCSLALAVLLFTQQTARFREIAAFFDTMRQLGIGMLPLMGALYAMGGNVGAAVANQSVMAAFLSLLETACSASVLPIAGVCLSFALVDALSGSANLRPLAAFIKRTFTLFFSFALLLLCGVLGLQTTLAKAGDTLALRTARFAAGSFLPVVGGSISETLRTVSAGVSYLRGVAGTGAMLVVFFAFLPIFLSVLLSRVAFLLGGAVAKMLGCESEEKILAEFGAVYGYFMAVIASLFVMMIFSLTLFARCATAG